LGTQIQGQTSVPNYLLDQAKTTGARNILSSYLQGLSKNSIRSIRISKGYRKNPRSGGTIITRSPGTRKYLGNSSLRTWEKNIKEDNVSIIRGNHSGLCLTGYTPFPGRCPPGKYII
jgi:hypothetical protein